MPYPTKYTRQYGFQGYQDANPSRPLPGDKVDADYNAVALSSDEVVEFLKLHTRSDGLLKNGVVSMDSLGADVLSAIALGDANAQASAVAVTPAGGITATNVQDALEDLDAALAGAGAVSSVFGRTGAITATAGDYTAAQVTNTPAGNIAATTVQAAINELDTEKLASASYTAADVLAKLLTVDGAGSGLDADTLDGQSSAAFQPIDADLTALAGLTSAADRLPYFTGSGTAALATFTAAGRALVDDADAAAQRVTLGVRDVLTAARNYYVRTDGSDSNTGLVNNSGGAFLTIQAAINAAAAVDTSTYNVTIWIADGTYTGANILKPITGAGTVTIRGNTTTPSNVLISTTSANCFYGDNAFGIYLLRGMKLQTTTSGSCILAAGQTYILPYEVEFGACSANHYHMCATRGATIYPQTAYTISGGAYSHMYGESGGRVINNNLTVTISGTFAFSYYARTNGLGMVQAAGLTFTGTYTVTGARYLSALNGVIDTAGGGASYFPGNAAGTATTGLYA